MSKKPVEIRDLLNFRFPENLQYSPEGTYLAFQVGQADEEKNTYWRNVWVIKDGKASQLTSAFSTSIAFWEDDETLVVTRQTEDAKPGKTVLYRINVNGGEAQEWITLPFAASRIRKVTDGVYAAAGRIRVDDPDAYKDSEETAKKKLEELKKEEDYHVVDEVPYWGNGAGYTNGMRNALFVFRTEGNLEVRRITDARFSLEQFIVEGTKVYYTGNVLNRYRNMYTKVYSYDTKTRKNVTVYGKETHSIRHPMCINGELYAQASDMKEYGVNQTRDIVKISKNKIEFVLDPHRSLYESIAGDTMLGGGEGSKVVDNAFYTLATNDDHVEVWKYDSDFNKTVLWSESGALYFMDVKKDKIAYARSTETELCEIYEMDIDGKNSVKLTDFNSEALKDKYVAEPQLVEYTSHDEQLHGWVLLPQNFNTRKKYPAVFDIHGGPRAVYGTEFFHEMQVWASKGYVVLFTNIRGSDGRDDAFADIRDQYGFVDFDNLMDFLDAVLAKYPNIDQKRICETGGSYGGFMTNWIITHTDRFCCAASQRSIANWVSMSFISDIGPWFGPDQCGADGLFGEANTEKLWNHSPLKYAAQCKTPTLFIHSEEDYRCPLPEGMQMMQALAVQNVETRMVIFKGENHELSRSGKPQHRIRRLTEITNWFDQHTK